MRLLPAGVLFAGMTLLAGCSWFGAGDAPPLPGERIPILIGDSSLEPDPEAAAQSVNLPPAVRNSEWSQPGGDAAHSLGHLALGSSLRQVWSASVGEGSRDSRRLLAQPVASDGRVFTLDARRRVSAFDLANGRRLWTRDLGRDRSSREEYFGGGVALGRGQVYVTTGYGGLYALAAENGEVRWETALGAPLRSGPTYHNGRVYASTTENVLAAVDAEDGEQLWSYSGLAEIASLVGGASPAAAGSTVIGAFSSGEVVALLADNGQLLWEDSLAGVRRLEQTANIAQVRGHPVIDDGLVVAISNSNLMLAIDQRTGMPVWEAALGGTQTPWVAGNTVFVVTQDAQLVALSRDNGAIRWVSPLQRFRNPDRREGPVVWAGPLLAGGQLILTNSLGQLIFASPEDGSIRHTQSLSGAVLIQPAVVDGTLLLVTDGGQLLALR
ncbi:MAG TPA: PQQ-binding-like beta-propeller repeat protein [Kiloniellales bacterium]|nr:PQQ-binding-like beta-propeller repeat protein [Kiloniellales bacterium]